MPMASLLLAIHATCPFDSITQSHVHHRHRLCSFSPRCAQSSANLITTHDRALRTPHSGYHYDNTKRRFFEGWYFKISIPDEKQSFAWMYSSEDPAFTNKTSGLEELVYGPRFPGIGAQVLGADEKYLCQYNEETRFFWGCRHELALGNTFSTKPGRTPPDSEVTAEDFLSKVEQGFQVTPFWHQGFLCDDGRLVEGK